MSSIMSSSRRSLSIRTRAPSSSKSFRGGHAPRPNDVFIAVMGVTGSGKSSFISLCSGKPVQIGHALNACTAKVDVYAYNISSDRTVYLIDTPGFDDTNRSDREVLGEIATWLGDSYKSNILLHGIIYLHRITDTRMQGSAKLNLLMFRELCGKDALKKVILVTTMWDKITTDEGVEREQQLKDIEDFWGWMLARGSICQRHNNTDASARAIVDRLAKHHNPIATDLQKQLVDQKLKLDETSAGRELQSEALKEREKMEKERRQFEENMKAARRQHDRELEEVMREQRDRQSELMKKADKEMAAFRADMETLLAQRDEREARMEKRMERRMEKQIQKQQAAHEEEIKRLQKEKDELEEARRQEKARQKEKARQEKTRQEIQAERAREKKIEQPISQVISPSSLTKAPGVYSPYSVTMFNGLYACTGPRSYVSNSKPWPKTQENSQWIDAVSIGAQDFGNSEWIARYSRGWWRQSSDLERQYPHLAAKIGLNGIGNLEFCVLGSGQRYFARWLNGIWSSWTSDEINAAVVKCNSYRDSRIVAMAFGYGDSYVISYGTASNMKQLGNWFDLKGYYPDLYQTLQSNKPLSIYAIALDPTSTTNYILVWGHHKDGLYRVRWFCSNTTDSQSIQSWWDQECA